jgi:hypothetical protein
VAEQAGLSFAALLRQLRAEARLRQEDLAEDQYAPDEPLPKICA